MNQEEKKKEKHVAFYIGSLHKGGAERVFVNLADHFVKRGYRVTMVTQYRYDNEYALPDKVERIISDITKEEEKGRIANFFLRYGKLRRIFREIHADVVLSTIGKNNFMALAANALLPTKVIVSVVAEPTEEYPTRLMRFLAKTLFYFADGIVMQTTDAVKFFQKGLQKKCIILKNSLNPVFIRPRYEGKREQEIVAVGRMDANKNQQMTIRAFAQIAEEFPKSRLTIYGDGELRSALRRQAEELGLSDRISLPGSVMDVADRIEKAYAFVLTSYTEGMPNTLIEAMALGIPSVSTDCPCGGPKDLITDGKNGFLVPVNDDAALAECLRRLLGDPCLADIIGREAYRISAEYSPEVVNASWENYFKAVVGRRWE